MPAEQPGEEGEDTGRHSVAQDEAEEERAGAHAALQAAVPDGWARTQTRIGPASRFAQA